MGVKDHYHAVVACAGAPASTQSNPSSFYTNTSFRWRQLMLTMTFAKADSIMVYMSPIGDTIWASTWSKLPIHSFILHFPVLQSQVSRLRSRQMPYSFLQA